MRRSPIALTAALALALTGCASNGDEDPGDAALTVVASMYPLQHLVEQVAGGVDVDVTVLTAPGADPHELELSPRDVAAMGAADLVVYSAGFQPAVDDAVATQASAHALDVSGVVDLVETVDEHDDHDEDDGHGHDHGGVDPHFWLDPTRYAAAADAVADRMAQLDPANAGTYEANAASYVAELEELDAEFTAGLADCAQRDVVTTHAAFGYLTARYGLHQIEMTGLAPDAEPSPHRVAEIVELVRDLGVTAVYAEVLAGSQLAETVARETGAQVLVLDPVEGITDASPGEDYLSVMRANLEALRTGQGCS